jgi:hypothetical protein
MKKLPFQIPLDDLLKALEDDETPTLEELISYENDVPIFLSKFKLETGTYLVRASLLYKLYKIFSKNPLPPSEFSYSCGNFIHRAKNNYYKLNISPIKLTKILNPPVNRRDLSSSAIKTHYEKFLEGTKVTKGTKWFEGFMLFEIYRFYCIDHKLKKRLRYENFVTISKLYFEHKRIGSSKGNWFKLDEEVFSILTPEHVERINGKRKKTEEWKKQHKISCPKGIPKPKK